MKLFLLMFLVIAHPVAADDIESALSITKKECQKLMRLHAMSGADYVPGVDAHGRKVKSADLNDRPKMILPEEITFDLGIDLAEKYGLGDGFYGKANLGKVKVKGRNVYWNGKKLGQNENDAVLDACRAEYGEK